MTDLAHLALNADDTLSWQAGQMDVEGFVARVRARPMVTFDELDTFPLHLAGGFEGMVDGILNEGWSRHGITIPFEAPLQWHSENRSFANHLHAWEPLSFILKAACTIADPAKRETYFQRARAVALDWLARFQEPAYGHSPAWAASSESVEEFGFTWYDMSVGQRIYRLAFVLELECRSETPDAGVVEALFRALVFHHQVLAVPEFFRSHTNHGVYQALGQLAAAKRFMDIEPAFEPYFDLAEQRLDQVLDQHYTPEGIHREHSPGYHAMLLGSLIGARQTDLIRNPLLQGKLVAMEESLTWMIQPNFGVAAFGDTDPHVMGSKLKGIATEKHTIVRVARRYATPGMQAIRTMGAIGELPKGGVRAYPISGYAYARLHGPQSDGGFEQASYLAVNAAFHSRTHKHADHLSFIWYDRGRPILIDPARYGYAGRTEPGTDLYEQGFWYSDPKRVYVETTRAHNCVEIDGQSYLRRKHKIFGSALTYAGQQGELAVTQCDMVHRRYIRHRRILVMKPGHFLMVIDWLNDRTASHEYRQFFKFAPEWSVSMQGNGYLARAEASETRPAGEITVLPLLEGCTATPPVCGQSEPDLLGWTSPEAYGFTPAPSIHFNLPEGPMARFATLFVHDASATADAKGTKLNVTLRNGTLAWKDRFGRHSLILKSDDDGLHVQLRSR